MLPNDFKLAGISFFILMRLPYFNTARYIASCILSRISDFSNFAFHTSG